MVVIGKIFITFDGTPEKGHLRDFESPLQTKKFWFIPAVSKLGWLDMILSKSSYTLGFHLAYIWGPSGVGCNDFQNFAKFVLWANKRKKVHDPLFFFFKINLVLRSAPD